MGWLTRIFKGSNHKIREGHYQGKYEDDTIWERTSIPADKLSDFDTEEIDRAVALSLEEEEEKAIAQEDENSYSEADEKSVSEEYEKSIAGADETSIAGDDTTSVAEEDNQQVKGTTEFENESYLEYDEQLAQALQGSLNFGYPISFFPPQYDYGSFFRPRYDYGSFLPHNQFFYPSGYGAEIGQGRFSGCKETTRWSPESFLCFACGQPVSNHELIMSENRPYHKSCYKELDHPKCDVCKNFIPVTSNGEIEVCKVPFWQQIYCPSHKHDGTPLCCCCERLEPVDAKHLILDDCRDLCLECSASATMDTGEFQPLYFKIQDFFEGLQLKVEQKFPMFLVDRQTIEEALKGMEQVQDDLSAIIGLTLSETQTNCAIIRCRKMSVEGIKDMSSKPYEPVRPCEVAILILFGFPRLLTGATLAHEMMHAWLILKGYPYLGKVEEGICEVLAYMWLDSEIKAGSGSSNVASTSSFEKKLGECLKYQMETNPSPVYGDGFREGIKAVNKYGLKRTLEHIRVTGRFPS